MTTVGTDAVIAGRYRLVDVIGSGGMGSVWRAEDEVLGRTVAVKLLRPEFAADEASRRRFHAEARAVASISHPNVVGVFDYGEQSTADGECLSFLVMEFVPGRSLAQELAAHGSPPAAAVVAILEQTALGLSAAHAAGVVHRDIKPANLLLSPNRVVKITDFGIARRAEATPLTRTGAVIGTAQYLSPEQAEGQGATPKSDLYSLGVVAFVCLSGAPPFKRESAVATLLAHVRDPVPPLPPETPPGLQTLVTDLLAKSPADRPSAEEVAARCRSGLLGAPEGAGSWRSVPPVGTRVLRSTEVQPRPADGRLANQPSTARIKPPAVQLRRPGGRRRALVIGAGAMAALALVGLFVALAMPSGTIRVPDVVGEALGSARSNLGHAGLAVAVRSVDAPKQRGGNVITETPKAGTSVGHGKVVQLTVSSGMVHVTPSAYIGLPFTTAEARLAALGVHTSRNSVAGSASPGSVVSVSPAGRVAVGSTVTLGVAFTPATTIPPTTIPPTTVPPTTIPPSTVPPTAVQPSRPSPPAHAHPAGPPTHGKSKAPKPKG